MPGTWYDSTESHILLNHMRNIVIQISNYNRLKKNKIFDIDIDPNLSVYVTLKDFLRAHGISLFTPDMINSSETECAIYMNVPYPWDIESWKKIIRTKNNILFAVEPQMINPFNYSKILQMFFKKIYTWNTALVDNEKYFQYNIAQSNIGLDINTKPFTSKKFLTFVVGNKGLPLILSILVKMGIFSEKELYNERLKALEYFENNIPENFDLYGKGWNKPKDSKKYKTYKGSVDNKIEVISNYKFCLCFENATEMNGYITEKIFDCFKAKCIPTYWGASDIEKYIPKNCFIDFRVFGGYGELILYLKNMKEEEYNRRIDSIEKLLLDQEFMRTWFEDGWVKDFSKKLGIL